MSETLEQIVRNLHQKMPMATQEDAIEFARRLVAALGAQEPAFYMCDGKQNFDAPCENCVPFYATPPIPQHQIPQLLYEAHDYGQFADDFNQPLAKPIRKAIRDMLDAVPQLPQREGWQWVPK